MTSPVGYGSSVHVGWEPEAGELRSIVEVLSKAESSDNAVQESVLHRMGQIKALPDAVQYLVTILCEQSIDVSQRKLAGLTLKNMIAQNANLLSPQAIHYAKQLVLKQLQTQQSNISDIIGTLITTIICNYGADSWPEALYSLINCLSSPEDSVFVGSMSALSKIVEDELTINIYGDTVMLEFCSKDLLPKLFDICEHGNRMRQVFALSCLMKFAHTESFAQNGVFEQFFPSFWLTLGKLASTNDPQIRKMIVEGMNITLTSRPEVIFESVSLIFNFMIECLNSSDYEVKQECVDFWSVVINTLPSLPIFEHSVLDILKNILPTLLPKLVENTVYSEKDYFSMDPSQFGDNSTSPDSTADIKPRFSQFRNESQSDQDEDDDEFQHTWGMQWTLRKGSARSLDILSNTFPNDVLLIVMPLIEQNFAHKNWEIRESAVLTLGAIAIGTMQGLAPYIPDVLTHLLNLCDDSIPLIRSITCWCISRFSPWICNATNHTHWLDLVLQKILACLLDTNKSVQEAACSAFATIEDEAREYLIPYLKPIINTLTQAFTLYQAKNLMILYDAIGTLAECVTYALTENNFGVALMEPLLRKWMNIAEHEPSVIAICECITCCARALHEHFYPFAPIVTHQCILRIQKSINEDDLYHSHVVSCCLNLFSAITEALQQQICDITNNPNNNFIPLLYLCCKSNFSTVLQSAFALVGDLTKHSIQQLKPYLPNIIPCLSNNLIHDATSVSNNAGWAIGQIAMNVQPEEIDAYLDAIMKQLIELLKGTGHHKPLLQNACITIGRLGILSPKRMSTILPQILNQWCIIMKTARDDDEKKLSFQGICGMIMQQPSAAAQCLPSLCEAIMSYQVHSDQSHHQFKVILSGIRDYYPDHWNELKSTMPPEFIDALIRRFSL